MTLGLGVGANSVMFALVNSVLLRPLPFRDAGSLVVIREASTESESPSSYPAYEYFRENARSIEELGFFGDWQDVLRIGDQDLPLQGARVSANVFSLLGMRPRIGRGLVPAEDEPGSQPVIVLSDGMWRNVFGEDPTVLGRSVRVGDASYTVIGVMPPRFAFPSEGVQAWTSMRSWTRRPQTAGGTMIGRLRHGVSMDQATAELDALHVRLAEDEPEARNGSGIRLKSLQTHLVGDSGQVMAVFSGAVVLLLLLACANVANLLLARASVRRKEIAIRFALGSRKYRIAQLAGAESMVLATVAGVVGVVMAKLGIAALVRFLPHAFPRMTEVGLDMPVVLFALGLSLLAGGLVGLVPALHGRPTDLTRDLRSGGRATGGTPLQSIFTVAQVAVAFMLLVGAGLLARTLWNLQSVELGFVPERALIVETSAPKDRYPDIASRADYFQRMADDLVAVPGVAAAGAVSMLPFTGYSQLPFHIDRPGSTQKELPWFQIDMVTPGFFQAMGIPLRSGRTFNKGDRAGALPVIIVNETLVHRFWPNENPIGRLLGRAEPDGGIEWRTVVGVVGDVRHNSLTEPASPKVYVPYVQSDWPFEMTMIVRTDRGTPTSLTGPIRGVIRGMESDPPVVQVSSLEDWVNQRLGKARFNVVLLAFFTAGALALAALGLYAVISFGVARRTRELGVRMALGATSWAIRRDVVGRGMKLTMVGMIVGGVGSLGGSRVLSSMLFDVSPFDPLVYAAVAIVLLAVTLMSTGAPSLRASRIEPLVALREE